MPVKITGGQQYEMIPEGVYRTVVSKIEEKTQFNRFNNAEEEGFLIEWTILEGEYKDRKGFRFFTPFLTPNSKLTALCKAILGREFTAEELAAIQGIDDLVNMLLNRKVMITIKNRTSAQGRQYYSVNDFIRDSSTIAAPVPRPAAQPQYVAPAPVAPAVETDPIMVATTPVAQPIEAAPAAPSKKVENMSEAEVAEMMNAQPSPVVEQPPFN
jgi:hypothetical protein